MFFDPLYLIFALPGLALSLFATFYTRSTFAKYSQVASRRGFTGAEAAREMLARNGIKGVTVEETGGFLSDHYDPRTRTLRLSPDVFRSHSLAALGVACHEAGHALQHAQGYAFLGLRTALVPATNIGSTLSYFVIMAGFLLRSQPFILVGAGLFSIAVVFSIVTLPVEWNASARAKRALVQTGVISADEVGPASAVLNAAFLTYVAAAVSSLLMLLYYLMRAGVFGGRHDD